MSLGPSGRPPGPRSHRPHRSSSITVATFVSVVSVVSVVALVATACGSVAANPPTGSRSTTPSGAELPPAVTAPTTPGRPGDLIQATEAAPPANARAWVVDYHSQAIDGHDVAERALLTIPMTTPPAGGFPVIVWGHSSKGVADDCAPSADGAAAIPLVDDLLGAGYAVVAPDYEGLGADGPHPYLVGESEGRSMLDAARAAIQVSGAGIDPSSPVVLWGYSQGGHAAAFGGQIAPSYAPELHLVGVAMAAPVADVDHFVRRAEDWPAQFGFLVTTVDAYARVYPGLDRSLVFTPALLGDLDELDTQCLSDVTSYYNRPIAQMLVKTPRQVPTFEARFAENEAGLAAIGVPVLVIQGDADQIVDPADTDDLVRRYCALHVHVSYSVRTGENHGVLSDDVLLPWVRGRLIGDTVPDDCSDLRTSTSPTLGGP
jgi:alpha-beta hydrolase superfamily lysophospholipase